MQQSKQESRLRKQISFKSAQTQILPRLPKQYGLIIKGQSSQIIAVVCQSLIVNSYEWQYNIKEMKIKCRTRINENDIWDDYNSEFSIEEFLKKNFIKFQISILRWSKEHPDTFMVDFMHIKSGINTLYFEQFNELAIDIRKRAGLNGLNVIKTFTLAEETLPNKGQGFEIVPSSQSFTFNDHKNGFKDGANNQIDISKKYPILFSYNSHIIEDNAENGQKMFLEAP